MKVKEERDKRCSSTIKVEAITHKNKTSFFLGSRELSAFFTNLAIFLPARRLVAREVSISIVFCSDSFIKKINRDYREKDKATDVISFPYQECSPSKGVNIPNLGFSMPLGEIVISLETAQKQCNEWNNTFEQEVFRLLIHGFLHILGYDHEKVTPSQAKRMRALEDELFRNLVA